MSLLIGFTGQGSQHPKMFTLLRMDAFGKAWLQEASDLLQLNLFDESIVENACSDVIKVQCLIVILSVGVFNAVNQQMKLNPGCLCGYSLGEVSAFCVSTNMKLAPILDLVKNRALLMQQACKEETGLVALKGNITMNQVKTLCELHACFIAIINGDDHYIVGGKASNLNQLLTAANASGVITARRLAVKLASHTPLLTTATDRFAMYLQGIKVDAMQYPILNALTQALIFNTTDMLPILAKELSETLHWANVMHIAGEYGSSLFLELGPGAALKNIAFLTIPKIKAYSVEEFSTINGLVAFLSKANLFI